jgi:hypothetical protein
LLSASCTRIIVRHVANADAEAVMDAVSPEAAPDAGRDDAAPADLGSVDSASCQVPSRCAVDPNGNAVVQSCGVDDAGQEAWTTQRGCSFNASFPDAMTGCFPFNGPNGEHPLCVSCASAGDRYCSQWTMDCPDGGPTLQQCSTCTALWYPDWRFYSVEPVLDMCP